jgi:putative peptidoglycan lipid II flippase
LTPDADPVARRRGLSGSAGIVSAAVLLSRVTGMAREVVMARLFGAGPTYDAFLLGMRIPNLTRNLFAEGALSSAFVPIFTRYLATKGRREAAELSNLVATALMVTLSALCLVGMLFSPELVRIMAPGFERVPGKFELAVLLTRIMFPVLLLISLAAQAMGLLNACDYYGIPALASTFFNIGSVGVGLAIGFVLSRSWEHGLIVSMAIGVVAGGMMQLAWQLPALYRAGFPYRPRIDWSDPGLREIFRLMAPALVGSSALQINTIVNTSLASTLTDASGQVMDGPVSWLGYAFRFLQLPLGVFGVAVASATLPEISRHSVMGRMDAFRDTVTHSLNMILVLTIPSTIGLAVLGESMIGVIYEGGRFTAADTHQTAMALSAYSVGLTGYAASKVLAPAFYALGDARTPMWVSVVSIAVNPACALALMTWAGLGHAGLALATSLVAVLGAALLFALLRVRTGFKAAGIAVNAAKIATASTIMGVACWVSSNVIRTAAGVGMLARFTEVAVSIPLGAAIFYAGAQALGIPEVEALRHACYTFLKRNAPRPESGNSSPGNR